jgi:hypothetical protein
MPTDRQIAANRENAKHSTGPATEAGLQISSMNRTSHGLTARRVVMKDESQEEFDNLHALLMDEYDPQSPTEAELVQELAAATWRLRRADRLETEALDEGRFDDLDKLRRYRTSIERAFHKAIDQLKKFKSKKAEKQRIYQKAFDEALGKLLNAPLPTEEIGFDSQGDAEEEEEEAESPIDMDEAPPEAA